METTPRSLSHVRSVVRAIDSRLNVSRHRGAASYYFWSDDEELATLLSLCRSTSVMVAHWSHQPIEMWQDDARCILTEAYHHRDAALPEEDCGE